MNDLTISIQDQLPKESIKMIGNQLGATEAQTELAIETINAVIMALIAQKTSVIQASSSMIKVLDRNKDGNYGDDLETFVQQISDGNFNTEEGKEIIEEIFSEHKQDVLKLITAASGVATNTAYTLLQALSPIVLNKIALEQQKRNWTVKELGNQLAEVTQSSTTEISKLVVHLFDKNGDGKISDDILKMAKNIFQNLKKRV
jgi:hypothetical protein